MGIKPRVRRTDVADLIKSLGPNIDAGIACVENIREKTDLSPKGRAVSFLLAAAIEAVEHDLEIGLLSYILQMFYEGLKKGGYGERHAETTGDRGKGQDSG